MQRVVSIHLNGSVYQIEEQGYNALFGYLDSTDSALQHDAERAQKLADLERLVAEKCQACLGPHKAVVTSVDIDRILLELGHPPSQPSGESASSSSSGSTSSSSTTTSPNQTSPHPSSHRRLFQIREGSMISGVCVGLSEFLHIDVTLIRILFVVFALASSGWGLLAYGVLMFVVPKVDTRADASAAAATGTVPPHRWPWEEHGWPWDKHGWPWDKHGWPWETHGWPWDQPGWDADAKRDWKEAAAQRRQTWREQRQQQREAWRAQREQHREAWRAQRAAHMGSGSHVFGTMTMIFFLMIGFFWLSFWTRGHFFFGWPFFWGFPHWFGIIFFFMMLRLVFMPFRASRWYGHGPYGPYAHHYGDHPHHAWASMWNGFAWFMVMIFAVWFAYHYIPEVHDWLRDFQSNFQTSWRASGFNV